MHMSQLALWIQLFLVGVNNYNKSISWRVLTTVYIFIITSVSLETSAIPPLSWSVQYKQWLTPKIVIEFFAWYVLLRIHVLLSQVHQYMVVSFLTKPSALLIPSMFQNESDKLDSVSAVSSIFYWFTLFWWD